jgi:hypothetical protein
LSTIRYLPGLRHIGTLGRLLAERKTLAKKLETTGKRKFEERVDQNRRRLIGLGVLAAAEAVGAGGGGYYIARHLLTLSDAKFTEFRPAEFPASSDALRRELVGFLRKLQADGFSFPSGPDFFDTLIPLLAGGKIKIAKVPFAEINGSYGFYKSEENTLYYTERMDWGLMLHELVHAYSDVKRMSELSEDEYEGLAYQVQRRYILFAENIRVAGQVTLELAARFDSRRYDDQFGLTGYLSEGRETIDLLVKSLSRSAEEWKEGVKLMAGCYGREELLKVFAYQIISKMAVAGGPGPVAWTFRGKNEVKIPFNIIQGALVRWRAIEASGKGRAGQKREFVDYFKREIYPLLKTAREADVRASRIPLDGIE